MSGDSYLRKKWGRCVLDTGGKWASLHQEWMLTEWDIVYFWAMKLQAGKPKAVAGVTDAIGACSDKRSSAHRHSCLSITLQISRIWSQSRRWRWMFQLTDIMLMHVRITMNLWGRWGNITILLMMNWWHCETIVLLLEIRLNKSIDFICDPNTRINLVHLPKMSSKF